MIISDTLFYRPDGTVSSVTRVTRESYTTPSGREVTEDVSTRVDLSAVTDVLDAGYAATQTRLTELEDLIAAERVRAETEKSALRDAHAAKLAAVRAEFDAANAAPAAHE